MKSDAKLDCIGYYCPLPIVHTAKKMKDLKPGEVLEIVADDVGIKEDMPNWCKQTGNEFLGLEEQGGQYKVFVKKTK